MKRTYLYSIAVALMLTGVAKIVLQASAQATLIIPTCLGASMTVPVEVAGTPLMHCWGCHVLLIGLVSGGALLLRDLRHSRLALRSPLF